MTPRIGSSFTQGYVLCSPHGVILGHSYRDTAAGAIEAFFTNPEHRDAFWKEAQAEGWSVEFVYARIFTPQYFAAAVIPQAGEEAA